MLNYNAPIQGVQSSVEGPGSEQMVSAKWLRKAIIESRIEQFFMPLANVTNMPKHMGKTIKVHEYIPLLDDRNVNSQGIDAQGVTIANGNLYGSSKDIGTISSRLPVLGENGGRVNRVGFKRIMREGSIESFGFFYEFSKEALDFDSDDGLREHLARELMNGAVKLTEHVIQRDLLLAAGTVVYSGAAIDDADVIGEGATPSVVSYATLMRLDQILTNLRTPKHTTVITGSRNVDTRTLPAARVIYVGSELVPLLRGLRDQFNNPAFIPVQQYGAAGTILNGEIGTIDAFRVVLVPEMLHWAGAGDEATNNNLGYRTTTVNGDERYDIYPMFVVGEDAFTAIGFQTSGQALKFNVITKMPGEATADRNDPYGRTGFSSIQWYYGLLVKRPERLGLIKTVAPI